MDASSLILFVVAAVVIFAASGAFAIAYRRSVGGNRREQREEPPPVREPAPGPTESVTVAAESIRLEAAHPETTQGREEAGVSLVVTQRVVEVSPEEAGITRRQFFNRAITATFGSYLALMGTFTLAFFWPRLTGVFGTKVDAGSVEDIKARLVQPDGSVLPFVVNDARAYVVPITPEQVEASQFDQSSLVADGLMAMWWRCVHLGCRTPWCDPSVGFECPCHGSKYNLLGEYQAGPAPRNLDRFAVEVTADGRLIIDTGIIVETPRAPRDTVPYPRGPSCIAI